MDQIIGPVWHPGSQSICEAPQMLRGWGKQEESRVGGEGGPGAQQAVPPESWYIWLMPAQGIVFWVRLLLQPQAAGKSP